MKQPKIAFENMHSFLVLYALHTDVYEEIIEQLWATAPGILFSRMISNVEISRGKPIPGKLPKLVTVYLLFESGGDTDTIAFVDLMAPSLAKEYATLLGGELCTNREFMQELTCPGQEEGVLVC